MGATRLTAGVVELGDSDCANGREDDFWVVGSLLKGGLIRYTVDENGV